MEKTFHPFSAAAVVSRQPPSAPTLQISTVHWVRGHTNRLPALFGFCVTCRQTHAHPATQLMTQVRVVAWRRPRMAVQCAFEWCRLPSLSWRSEYATLWNGFRWGFSLSEKLVGWNFISWHEIGSNALKKTQKMETHGLSPKHRTSAHLEEFNASMVTAMAVYFRKKASIINHIHCVIHWHNFLSSLLYILTPRFHPATNSQKIEKRIHFITCLRFSRRSIIHHRQNRWQDGTTFITKSFRAYPQSIRSCYSA